MRPPLIAVLCVVFSCGGPPLEEGIPIVEAPEGEWSLLWEDNFDGPEGTLPDPEKWGFDIGGDGWGNAQLEYNTDRVENAGADGLGNLLITARVESFGGNAYTSARILTKRLFTQAYGRFEARIKIGRAHV